MYRRLLQAFTALACVSLAVTANSTEPAIYVKNARVQRPTRLDWVFTVQHESPAKIPASLLNGHAFVNHEYEFFGPRRRPARPLPLILYISPGRSLSWDRWEPVCRKHGILFAGIRHAGNRDVVEILGDVRRRYSVDPDRTYIAGFSAGAGLAEMIAFRLPEYFGGVISIGSLVQLPAERCGYEVSMPDNATSTGAVDETVTYDLNKASFHALKKAVLGPLGLVLHKKGRKVCLEFANETR